MPMNACLSSRLAYPRRSEASPITMYVVEEVVRRVSPAVVERITFVCASPRSYGDQRIRLALGLSSLFWIIKNIERVMAVGRMWS